MSGSDLQRFAVRAYSDRVPAATGRHHELVSRRLVADGTRPGISSLACIQHLNWHSTCQGQFITSSKLINYSEGEVFITN
jgi:hypothetical protein